MIFQTAQSVSPNAKCASCLHYASNQGPTGVCLVGLQPFVCGNGEHPDTGYNPFTLMPASTGARIVGPAQATTNADAQWNGRGKKPADILGVHTVVLGDEHAQLAKAIYEELVREREDELKVYATQGLTSKSVPQVATPELPEVTVQDVAREFVKHLDTREKTLLKANEVAEFIYQVIKAYRRPANNPGLSKPAPGDTEHWLGPQKPPAPDKPKKKTRRAG